MGWIIVVLAIIIVFAIIQVNSNSQNEEEARNNNNKALQSLDGFEATKKIVGLKNEYMFCVDENSKNVAYIKGSHKEIIPFDQIISVEVLEDNTILQQKSSLRTIGGAVLGGAVAGGAGAIVGGLSGSTSQNKKVSRLQVKIKLRDINRPSFTIDCFNCKTMTVGGSPIKPSGMEGYLYKQGLQDANCIADTVSAIIDITDKTEKNAESIKPHTKKMEGSVADELLKLAELKDKGILTEEEFQAQKKVLLGNPSTSTANADSSSQSKMHIANSIPPGVKEALEYGNPILATKLYKDYAKCSLEEAKAYIDSIR